MLRYLETEDSPQRAAHCKHLLDVSYRWLYQVSESTQQIMLGQTYKVGEREVDISLQMRQFQKQKYSIAPEMMLPKPKQGVCFDVTEVQVRNETTLMTARELVKAGKRPLVLNFANGTHVGGGFLRGARAQEETLCYASSLYATLVGDAFYTYNQQFPAVSSDYAILSKAVVFKDDQYQLIEEPWTMDVLTAAAPIAKERWGGVSQLEGARIMDQRIARVLDIAIAYGYSSLVLGAWGCGAFGNDPVFIAKLFEKHLKQRCSHFETVHFAISDWSRERRFLRPFAEQFSSIQ